MTDCLLIFYKVPELSPVKTRLASVIGQVEAQNVYQKLVQHTINELLHLSCHKHVFYYPQVVEQDIWTSVAAAKHKQSTGDLGDKMSMAFKTGFQMQYKKVIIIGTDCPEITHQHISRAFEMLDSMDVVIGPAADGGYYLLGMKQPQLALFKNILWSTTSVFSSTMQVCKQEKLSYSLLETLHDIDEAEDLKYLS